MIYGHGSMIAEVAGNQTATPEYRLLDHLGSLAMTTDNSSNVTGADVFLPFGQLMSSTTNDSFQFTGLEQDTEYGGDSAWYRNFSTEQSRWLRPDPYNGSYDIFNPQSFNRYSYVENNPLRFVDPSGLHLGSCYNAHVTMKSCGIWGSGNPYGSLGNEFDLMEIPVYGYAFGFIPFDQQSWTTSVDVGWGTGYATLTTGSYGWGFFNLGSGFLWGTDTLEPSTSSQNGTIARNAPNKTPPVPKPPNPILQYAQCSAQVQNQAKKNRTIANVITGVSLGNGVIGCFFAGPGVVVCEGVVGGLELLVDGATEFAYQSAIYDGETQCMQAQ